MHVTGRYEGHLTLTCQTLWPISYDPGPSPSSSPSPPPMALAQAFISNDHTARDMRPAATRYSRHVDAIRKS